MSSGLTKNERESLNDHSEAGLIDHIGLDLWRAGQAWKRKLTQAMVARGHAWFAEARGNLIAHMDRAGTRQAELVRRSGLTKQAVQQFVDELEKDGIAARVPDPDDRRGKIVIFTGKGHAALRDSNDVKRMIERDYEARLGREKFAELYSALKRLADDE